MIVAEGKFLDYLWMSLTHAVGPIMEKDTTAAEGPRSREAWVPTPTKDDPSLQEPVYLALGAELDLNN